jgi:hypothetical protein
MKSRIIERTNGDDKQIWVIQQKHFLLRWWWVDAWVNSSMGTSCNDRFSTLEEAKMNLCYFDDRKAKEKAVA